MKGRSNRENLEEAFTLAEAELGIPRLLDPEGASHVVENSFNYFHGLIRSANS